jgi:hypothetical protein
VIEQLGVPFVSAGCVSITSVFVGAWVSRTIGLAPRQGLLRLALASGMGLLVLTTGVAAAASSGWSSAFGVFLVLGVAALSVRRRPSPRLEARVWIAPLALLTLGTAVYAAWLAYWHLDASGAVVRAPLQRDTPHYVVLTAFLDRVGVETPQPHFLSGVTASRAPYHYLDAWLAVLVARLFKTGHLVAYIAVAQALLGATLTLAVAALVARLTRSRPVVAVGCALTAVMAGFEPLARVVGEGAMGTRVEKLFGGLELYVMPPFEVNKMHPAAILLAFSILAAARRQSQKAAPWVLAALPTAYLTFTPFACAMWAIAIASSLRRKAYGAALNAAMAAITGVLLVLPALEWKRNESFFFLAQKGGADTASLQEVLGGAVRVVGGGGIRLAVLVSVLFALWWFGTRRASRLRSGTTLWLPVIAGLAGSLAAWAITHRSIDSWQLLTTTSSATLAILSAVALGAVTAKVRHSLRRGSLVEAAIALGLVALAFGQLHSHFASMANRFDREFSLDFRKVAQSRAEFTAGDVAYIGVWFRGSASFKEVYDYNLGSATHAVAFMMSNHPYTVVLPVGQIPLAEGLLGERQRAMLGRSPLTRTLKALPGDERWQSQVEPLILSQRIGYVLVDTGVELSDALRERVSDCESDRSSQIQLCRWR